MSPEKGKEKTYEGGARADGGGDNNEGDEDEEDEYEGYEEDFMAGAKAAMERIKEARRKADRRVEIERPRSSETRY